LFHQRQRIRLEQRLAAGEFDERQTLRDSKFEI